MAIIFLQLRHLHLLAPAHRQNMRSVMQLLGDICRLQPIAVSGAVQNALDGCRREQVGEFVCDWLATRMRKRTRY